MTAGVYLHIPFCKARCSYCDFATDVYRGPDVVERYVDALCKEIAVATLSNWPPADAGGSDIDTVYLGGGTPSLLTPPQLERILKTVHDRFDISPEAEITMEMNPATVTPDTLTEYKKLGVNRASFGVQTFDDRALKLLARGHDADDARTTFKMLRDAGFENISFDLIAGLPNQTLEDWSHNLDQAIAMSPVHLSLYLLEIHEGTPLAEQVRERRQPRPDDDLAAAMYEMMLERLADAGYEQYEISNFARPGFESRHNTKYWRLDPVYGFGVSAHSFDGVERYANERDMTKYVELVENTGCAEVTRETIDAASEFMFLGLRLNDGLDVADYQNRFGVILSDRIANLSSKQLVEIVDGRLRLTLKGMLFSNEVFVEFV